MISLQRFGRARSRPRIRQLPVVIGSNGVNTGGNITTTSTTGQFLMLWETIGSLSVPALVSGFNNLATPSADGTQDVSARLSWREVPSDNYTVPLPGTSNRCIAIWLSGVDLSDPVVETQPISDAVSDNSFNIPSLAAFSEPWFVGCFSRLSGTSTGDLTTAGFSSVHIQNSGNAEARCAAFTDRQSSWAGATVTTSGTPQKVGAVFALRGTR